MTRKSTSPKKTSRRKPAAKKINLALQGGGAHGSYTWGVLDRLLQEDNLEIEGISGTSAGAMNAAILACGMMKGGREEARMMLWRFWEKISSASQLNPWQKSLPFLSGWNLSGSPSYNLFDIVSRLYSPYDLNPLNLNPLRILLQDFIDEDALKVSPIRLFITATHIASGQARVFHCEEINTDVLLASACIPFMSQAVKIEEEYYWDGGYMGNPAIWPLIYHTASEDILLVQINPLHRDDVPKRAYEIINRLNEISFNSSLIAEMRAIEFVQRLIHDNKLSHKRYKDLKIHLIYSPEEMHHLDASSKMNTGWDFFKHLYHVGFEAADRWVAENSHAIGKRSTVDIREKFLYRVKTPAPTQAAQKKPKSSRRKK